MIVIRRDTKIKRNGKTKRSILPFIGTLIVFALLVLLIPIGLTLLTHLPWYLTFIYPFGIVVGIILIILGIWITYRGIKDLKLRYSHSGYERDNILVTTGIYAYTRNPMYFGAIIMSFGWFLVLPFTFLLISTILFIIMFYLTAKSEEKQLSQKFGREYIKYKQKVPLFVPYSKFKN